MLEIPLILVRHKQVFRGDMLTLAGKPVDVARRLKEEGAKLIHIVDEDALAGLSSNLDIYDDLTFFINVQVECAPDDALVKKLLSLKCRVVLPPGRLDVSRYREKKLLVAKVRAGHEGGLEGFHDVLLEDADDAAVARFSAMGKRVMVYAKDLKKLKSPQAVWGAVTSIS